MATSDPANNESPSWTFLSNHAHVLVCIAKESDVRLSEVARLVGIGERAVHRIVHELIEAGYVSVTKLGRRNVYDVNLDLPLRHPLESNHEIRAVIAPLLKKSRG